MKFRGSLILLLALALAGCSLAEHFDGGVHPTVDAGPADAGVEPPSMVTVAGCWSPPIVVSPPLAPSSGWHWDVGALPDGVLVAWDAEAWRVVARTATPDAGRGAIQTIFEEPPDGGPGAVTAVRVSTTHEGARAIGWLWADPGAKFFAFDARTDQSTSPWSEPIRFNEDTSREILAPDFALDAFTRLVATWEQVGPTGQSAGVQSRFCEYSGCQPVATLTEPDTILTSPPQLSPGPTAGALVTWLGYHPPTYEIRAHASIMSANTSWHLDELFPATERATLSSGLSEPNAVVAMGDVDGVHASVWNATSWTPSTLDAGASPRAAFLTYTPAVLSVLSDGGAMSAAFSRYEEDGGWGTPIMVDTELGFEPSAFVGSSWGEAWAMWRTLDGQSFTLVRLAPNGSVLEKDSVVGLHAFGNPKLLSDGHGGWWLVGLERDALRLVAMHCPESQ